MTLRCGRLAQALLVAAPSRQPQVQQNHRVGQPIQMFGSGRQGARRVNGIESSRTEWRSSIRCPSLSRAGR